MKQNSFSADCKLMQALDKRSQPKGLYIIRSGEAALVMQSPSGEIIFSLRAPAGSLLGLPAVIGNEPTAWVQLFVRTPMSDL